MRCWKSGAAPSTGTTLLVGDRANLNDELALAFDKKAKIRYLAGLEPRKKAHRALLQYPDAYFLRQPLAPGYWGMPCKVHFEHADQQCDPPGSGGDLGTDAHGAAAQPGGSLPSFTPGGRERRSRKSAVRTTVARPASCSMPKPVCATRRSES